jgi:hypothetical protein
VPSAVGHLLQIPQIFLAAPGGSPLEPAVVVQKDFRGMRFVIDRENQL